MKLVDEKGRLFGKLNIIDFLVIILLVAAVALVGIKLMGKGGGAGGGTQLTYTVVVKGVDGAAYENAKEYILAGENGDQLMANGELLDGWVTDVKSEPNTSGATLVTTENGEKLEVLLSANTLDLTFTIKANISNTTTSEVGTQEVRIGKTHIVKTTHFEFANGTILSCQWDAPTEG